MGLLDHLPSRRRRRREEVEAAHDAAITQQREQDTRTDIQAAYVIADKLAEHRRRNHFADRMRAAYGRQEGRA